MAVRHLNHSFDEWEVTDISFGDLSQEELADMFTDGRLVSHFLERQLTKWYPELTFVDGRGYDHVDTEGNLYDQKCFTKGGLTFAPSNMIGKGRSIDESVASEHVKNITYICCDVIDFPLVKVKFESGSALEKDYPKFKIPLSKRKEFFCE